MSHAMQCHVEQLHQGELAWGLLLLGDWLGIGQRVMRNCAVHHLLSVFFYYYCYYYYYYFPSFSVLLNCLYPNLQVLPFFQFSPPSPGKEAANGCLVKLQQCSTYVMLCMYVLIILIHTMLAMTK